LFEDDAESLAYPRPLLRRKRWTSLNGPWSFAIDAEAVWTDPGSVVWDQVIEVPFAPETKRSGINKNGLYSAVWYRREVDAPAPPDGERLILRFGAIDYHATVWLGSIKVGEHEGRLHAVLLRHLGTDPCRASHADGARV
jgi:beta-galactosidase/beta-glucuronidase